MEISGEQFFMNKLKIFQAMLQIPHLFLEICNFETEYSVRNLLIDEAVKEEDFKYELPLCICSLLDNVYKLELI